MTLYSAYNMHQRIAQSLRVGRVLLAGDAAHVTNPTNGFGLVSGMLDSQVLSGAELAVGLVLTLAINRASSGRTRPWRSPCARVRVGDDLVGDHVGGGAGDWKTSMAN